MSDPNYPRYDQTDPQQPGGAPQEPGPQGSGSHPREPAPGPGPGSSQEPGSGPRYEGQPAPQYGGQHPQQQYGGQPYRAQYRSEGEPGFWAALFDLSFKHFITIKFATFIYVLAIVLSCLGGLVMVISGFAALTQSATGLLVVIFGLVATLINIVIMRVFLEFVISMIRTAQNTSVLAQRR